MTSTVLEALAKGIFVKFAATKQVAETLANAAGRRYHGHHTRRQSTAAPVEDGTSSSTSSWQ
jgi:hypothetical protein